MAIKGPFVSRKKGAKKGTKKKVVDLFSKKEWFDLRIPSVFSRTFVGKTLATRSSARQSVDKLILNRCFEASQGDIHGSDAFRIFKFIVSAVRGNAAICSFAGMRLTTDKVRGIIKRGHTLIEADMLVKTTDDYILRVFVLAQSKKNPDKQKAYIQTSRVKEIRQNMFSIIEEEFKDCDIAQAMDKMTMDKIGSEIETQCSAIHPLQNCVTTKVQVVKRPKFIQAAEDNTVEMEDVGHTNPNVVEMEEEEEEEDAEW